MQNIRDIEQILKALANRRRLSMLKYLRKEHSATVGNIAKKIQLSMKATSKHLRLLSMSGIVESEQVGLNVAYSIKEPIHRLTKLIVDSL